MRTRHGWRQMSTWIESAPERGGDGNGHGDGNSGGESAPALERGGRGGAGLEPCPTRCPRCGSGKELERGDDDSAHRGREHVIDRHRVRTCAVIIREEAE